MANRRVARPAPVPTCSAYIALTLGIPPGDLADFGNVARTFATDTEISVDRAT